MDDFARLPHTDRQDALRATAVRRGISAALLEKDFWVCWTLRRLHEVQGPAAGVLFKGGTSLSKVYKAIERFSEDIDLSLDRAALGFGGAADPGAASSGKQRKRRLEELSEACRIAIKDRMLPALTDSFSKALGKNRDWKLELAADDPDAQTLVFLYPRGTESISAYMRPTVRLEFGARSDHWPAIDAQVSPYVAEDFPQMFKAPQAKVRVLSAERTFWEKATALHAWHSNPKAVAANRRSRHYYDVMRLYEHRIGQRAIQDTKLLAEVARHKALFFPAASAHYDLAKPGTLKLSPPESQLDALWRDYQSMAEMFFAPPPPFDHILVGLSQVETIINASHATGPPRRFPDGLMRNLL